MKNKSIIQYIKTAVFILVLLCFASPIDSRAESISLSAIGFDDHRGMMAYINGKPVYCIQRGYPFRSSVSELQMVSVSVSDAFGGQHNGTIASNVRYLMNQQSSTGKTEMFRGWGQWSLNGDRTDATQSGTDGAPTSKAWQEEFDEDMEDDEDSHYNNRHQGSGGNVTKWSQEVKPYLTGHEGSVDTFATSMREISYQEAGLSISKVYAMAMVNYYCYDDPDSSRYSTTAKYQTKQALDWAIEYGFVDTEGRTGDRLQLVYKDSAGYYGVSRSRTYSGSCDGYIKTTIGNQYEAMKLYRQVVWKTTNMRMIPSFAYRVKDIADADPIKLYWDEEQQLYTATVADANGVLKYFDFEIPGVTCTENEDGTLTISSEGQIDGELTSLPKASALEPEDGVFRLPDFYRWDLEGRQVTYKYTAFVYDQRDGDRYFVEQGNGRRERMGVPYNHSHYYDPACNWYCKEWRLNEVTHCTKKLNSNYRPAYTDSHGKHHSGGYTKHKCDDECRHRSTCPYVKNRGNRQYWNGQPNRGKDACDVTWCCGKQHFYTVPREITGTYIDWQDVEGVYAKGQKLIDPTYAYIKVVTVPHDFPAETDTEILLIADNDEWNDLTYTMPNGQTVKHCSHLRVGEKFHLKYIYSYTGASKGFRIKFSVEDKPYYQYNYLARMQSPYNVTKIYDLRSGLFGDRFSVNSIGVPHARLALDETPITIRGLYTTGESAYTLNGTYTYDSGVTWDDSVYLDALTTDQYDDWYDNRSADNYEGLGEKIITTNTSPEQTAFTVTKQDDRMQIVWVYDTEPEVFTSALIHSTAYIHVGENDNYTKTFYDEAYDYAADEQEATEYTQWFWDFEEHNHAGGVGYFSSEYISPDGIQSNESVPSHTIYTQNNEYDTYAVRNKVWQSDIDIKVSDFVQNTGAGITEHTYQDRDRDTHDLNYNLYYTIDVENPKATIFEDKIKSHDDQSESDTKTMPYDTASDVNEFDVNTLISWGSTGESQTAASYGKTVVVDHIRTGTTYIQREIPTVLHTMTGVQKETMMFQIYPNHDRLIYEDYYSGVNTEGSATDRKVTVSMKDSLYPDNEQTAASDIFAAMNPNHKMMQPQNINGSGNVPNTADDEHITHAGTRTSFNIRLSNRETKTVTDTHTKSYKQYDFTFNTGKKENRVTFGALRKSVMFFKYSKTDYDYNNRGIESATGIFAEKGKSQTESYYISQVLFKSNYTEKYQKELEAQGAEYIKDADVYGNVTDTWIDMVNQNQFAIVAAGQGFELRVTVKYENDFLTQYLARYFGHNDAQHMDKGSSYPDAEYLGPQYCNISAMTGFLTEDGKSHAYINGISTIDRLAVNLVTGSNVYKDLYCFMSDNPDTVYSYSGIYDTPVVFDRKISYSRDFSVTTITYTMCMSHENGISSSLQRMKFYTNQLAPDKRSPGIVEGTYDVAEKGEHSVTLWTPVIAATPFDYPETMQDRYIGDAIELGYTIRTTGADDSIVHIVQ